MEPTPTHTYVDQPKENDRRPSEHCWTDMSKLSARNQSKTKVGSNPQDEQEYISTPTEIAQEESSKDRHTHMPPKEAYTCHEACPPYREPLSLMIELTPNHRDQLTRNGTELDRATSHVKTQDEAAVKSSDQTADHQI